MSKFGYFYGFIFSWFPSKIPLKNVNRGFVELKRRNLSIHVLVIGTFVPGVRHSGVRDHFTWGIKGLWSSCSSLPTWGFSFQTPSFCSVNELSIAFYSEFHFFPQNYESNIYNIVKCRKLFLCVKNDNAAKIKDKNNLNLYTQGQLLLIFLANIL